MAKTKISQYDATAANNTDIDSINIAEGMAPSNVNNAIRELMAHLKDMDAGTQALTSPQLTSADINGGTIDGVTIGGASAGAGTFTNLTATGTTTLAGASTSADITFGDNDKAIFGASSDLSIYHDGNNKIEAISGYLRLASTTSSTYVDGNNVHIRSGDGGETLARFNDDSDVKLYYDNEAKFATSSSGVDITGVLSSDGLTVESNTGAIAKIGRSDTAIALNDVLGQLDFTTNDASTTEPIRGQVKVISDGTSGNSSLYISTASSNTLSNRIKVGFDGDISFYDSLGSSQSFFWDANEESLGIGTSSPNSSSKLHVEGGAAEQVQIRVSQSDNTGAYLFSQTSSSGVWNADNTPMLFATNNAEAMRIDAGGNLLVGTPSLGNADVGVEARANGTLTTTADSQTALFVKRIGSGSNDDGELVRFQNADGTVGSIGTINGMAYFASGDVGIRPNGATDTLYPTDGSGTARDNAVNFGDSGSRFKDLYLSGGTLMDGTGIKANSTSGIVPTNASGALADGTRQLGSASTRWQNLYLSGSIEIENGTGNVGVGKQALNSNTGSNNTAVGYRAGYSGITASENVIIGTNAGYSLTSGVNNTFVGGANPASAYGAGGAITTGSKNTILGRYDGNQGGLDIRESDNNIVLSDGDGNPRLHIDSNNRMVLNASYSHSITDSNFALNNNPSHGISLDIVTNSNSDSGMLINCDTNDGGGTSTRLIDFRHDVVVVGSITQNGSSTSYNTTSDYRLKENVVDLTNATDRLKQLEPKRFNFIADADNTVDGFLAHEVQAVVPEAITGTHNEIDADGNPVYQGIDQSKLVPLLVATIKELEARITALENA
jgi:hypothetical protein